MKFLLRMLVLSPFSCFAELEVHEWGSINIVTGTDQISVGDISDDQSDLPSFVRVWKEDAVAVPAIMEKPIIYFYSDKVQDVDLSVSYPKGIFTQWWPIPEVFTPRYHDLAEYNNGSLNWNFKIFPDEKFDSEMPEMKDHPWWNIARDVDAATIKSTYGGTEKFLFYRGAGSFKPTLKVDTDDSGNFLLSNEPNTDSKDIYTIDIKDNAEPLIHYYSALKGGKLAFNSIDEAAKHLQVQLENKGLFKKEATGLVQIWKKQMFEQAGQRVMYMMSESDIEKMLPLSIKPKPDKQVRVMIIRFECLTASHRKKLKAWIEQLSNEDYKLRKTAHNELLKTGRIGEAVMRSAYKTTENAEVKLRLKEILEIIIPKNPNP